MKYSAKKFQTVDFYPTDIRTLKTELTSKSCGHYLFYSAEVRFYKTELTSKSCGHYLFHSAEVRFYKTELTSKILQWHDLRACPRPVCTEACKERSGGK